MKNCLFLGLALTLIPLNGFSGWTSSTEGKSSLILPTGVSEKRLATEMMWQAIKNLPVGERPRIILVLGGGGARGLCHIGVLKVLEQEQIPIDAIVGVSVGALIGALYAGGMSADQIQSMAQEVGWNQLSDLSKTSLMKLFFTENLISTEKMELYLKRQIGDKHFSDLKIPFACVATDIRTGERVIFQEGPVAVAARASATIPGIFKEVEYRHRSLVDGGLVDNLPTDIVIKSGNDIVVGVLPNFEDAGQDYSTVIKILIRSIEIQKDVMIHDKRKMADFMIEPNVGTISMIDLARTNQAIEAGTIAARANILNLKALVIERTKIDRAAQHSRGAGFDVKR